MSEDWDFYRLRVDDQPASIMVDLGIRHSVPLETHKHMGYLRTHMNNPRSDGLSSQEEFDKLCEIGDTVKNSIESSDGTNLYVGRNTSDNNRDFYFYTLDLEKLYECLEKVVQAFPEYRFTIGGREDSSWTTYLNFLYPNPSQEQQIQYLCKINITISPAKKSKFQSGAKSAHPMKKAPKIKLSIFTRL